MNKYSLATFLLSIGMILQAQIKELSDDGTWCWFSAPGAVYHHNGLPQIVTGWVKADGSIEAAVLNYESDEISTQIVSPKLDKDDHANPGFVELENNEVLMMYTKHFDEGVRSHRLNANAKKATFSELQMIEVFNEAQFKRYPKKGITYANPISLSDENGRLFVFGRWTGYKPNMLWSDDNGRTYNDAQVYITNKPFDDVNRPYVKYYSDGKSKIHIIFTDGHPRKEPTNSVYYAYYEKGAFWRVDGSKICDLENIPFEPKEASVIYKATKESGRAWVYDVTQDKKGNPVVLYARYPKESEHLYHYAKYEKGKWIDHKICNSGKWFPQTPNGKKEREPHYSAGLTFHPSKSNTIYLSRDINGVFEIEKRVTKDKGNSWDITPITSNSKYDNVRPIVPKNPEKRDKTVVLWMENEKYIHYSDYKTRVKYMVENK
ncbi:BNR-4 repeat-containing protein [Saccharicrinis aurantiacus]|uniref:BNR-4 repeat-containing protein n=1 Tax=Saccharicrinis aurantiacus TaxID=1849719 RepID=UPI00249098FA|nr:BNR-4 repeat-containing protein [Saccharicrinis aurantiacus]